MNKSERFNYTPVLFVVFIGILIAGIVQLRRVHSNKLEYIFDNCSFDKSVHLYVPNKNDIIEVDRKYYSCPEGIVVYDEDEFGAIKFRGTR